MSAHWKDLLDDVIYGAHGALATTIYCLIDDYHTKKIDVVCNDFKLKQLKRRCLEEDPNWCSETFEVVKCDRCCDKKLLEDTTLWYCNEYTKPNTRFCEGCLFKIKLKQEEEIQIKAMIESECHQEWESLLVKKIQANPERYGFLPNTKPDSEPFEDQIERHIETMVELHANK